MPPTDRDLPPETSALRHRLATVHVQGQSEGLNGYSAGERARVERVATDAVTHLHQGTFVFPWQPCDPSALISTGVDPAAWRAR